MSETPPAPTPNPPAGVSNTGSSTPAPGEGSPSPNSEHLIPKSRFDEVNNRAKKAEEELARINTEREQHEAESAKAKGEWEKLANQATSTISELKPKLKTAEELVERYRGALDNHVKVLRKDIPDHISALLDKLDPVEQLEWITKNRDQISANQTLVPRGNGAGPRPAGVPTIEDRSREIEQRLVQSGKYRTL